MPKKPPKVDYSEKQINSLLDGIYTGAITEYQIPQDLYEAIAEYLKDALYKGYGGNLTDFVGKDLELLKELRENVYQFSAAKSFQQIKDIRSMMFDENMELVSNREFNKLGLNTYDRWIEDWGLTEYNTAVAQATMAGKWNEIEANKDLLPNLRYSTIGDACDICAPLDGLTAPVDDPIWNTVTPSNHFNCLCTVIQLEADAPITEGYKETVDEVSEKMDDMFKMNSGKDGYIFKEDHDYFTVDKKDVAFAKNNFNLPIPDTDD